MQNLKRVNYIYLYKMILSPLRQVVMPVYHVVLSTQKSVD